MGKVSKELSKKEIRFLLDKSIEKGVEQRSKGRERKEKVKIQRGTLAWSPDVSQFGFISAQKRHVISGHSED